MILPREIHASASTLQKMVGEMKGVLQALRKMPLSDVARVEVTNGAAVVCCLTAECHKLLGLVNAAEVTGQMETGAVKTADLELHPGNWVVEEISLLSLSGQKCPLSTPDTLITQEVWDGQRITTMRTQRTMMPDELRLMEEARHREGDYTQDREGGEP